ncbi:MAG: chorismate pyruvate-lyase family protein [Deltaproteobacteria bacterium]|nr:chorismate pyruvate-lyase family protein [Deltaproteobacteria bacterium]
MKIVQKRSKLPVHAAGAGGVEAAKAGLIAIEGSLTLAIERIYGALVEAELIRGFFSEADKDAAASLNINTGEKILVREVWLKVRGERLVYALTLVDCSATEKGLVEALRAVSEPLGKLLEALKAVYEKLDMQSGVMDDENEVRMLGMHGAPLNARSFRLVNAGAQGPKINAFVTEVFSRELTERCVSGGRPGEKG